MRQKYYIKKIRAQFKLCINLSTTLGRLKVLDYLINELGLDAVVRDKDKMSSVHAATQGNHPTTVKVHVLLSYVFIIFSFTYSKYFSTIDLYLVQVLFCPKI